MGVRVVMCQGGPILPEGVLMATATVHQESEIEMRVGDIGGEGSSVLHFGRLHVPSLPQQMAQIQPGLIVSPVHCRLVRGYCFVVTLSPLQKGAKFRKGVSHAVG